MNEAQVEDASTLSFAAGQCIMLEEQLAYLLEFEKAGGPKSGQFLGGYIFGKAKQFKSTPEEYIKNCNVTKEAFRKYMKLLSAK